MLSTRPKTFSAPITLDRHYEPSDQRKRVLRDLIASEGMDYIERYAARLPQAEDLKILLHLQTNRLVEDGEIRARVWDGEYDPKPERHRHQHHPNADDRFPANDKMQIAGSKPAASTAPRKLPPP
jgi:hypothetical protein